MGQMIAGAGIFIAGLGLGFLLGGLVGTAAGVMASRDKEEQ